MVGEGTSSWAHLRGDEFCAHVPQVYDSLSANSRLRRWLALGRLVDRFKYSCVVMVGDGVTDMQVRLHGTAVLESLNRIAVKQLQSALAEHHPHCVSAAPPPLGALECAEAARLHRKDGYVIRSVQKPTLLIGGV